MKKFHTLIGVASVLCILALIAVPASAFFPNAEKAQGDRMDGGAGPLGHLDRLEERGYDVSEIRTAIENGDHETARTLLQQFMEEHKGELPAGSDDGKRGFDLTNHLDRIEDQGYDVSEIRTALENGDHETARTLLQQFMEEHKDELPARPDEGCRGPLGHLDRLEAQGYDVSEIRTAIENGDHETARTLLQQFMEEHKDELPARPQTDNFMKKAGGNRTAAGE